MFQNFNEIWKGWQNLYSEPKSLNPFADFFQPQNAYQDFVNFFKNFQENMLNQKYFPDFNTFQETFKKFQEQYTEMVFKNFGLNNFNLMGLSPFFDLSKFKEIPFLKDEFLSAPSLGLTREYIDGYKLLIKNYKDYLEKTEKFREAISKKAKEGFEKFIESVKDTNIFEDFDKAFKKWVEINESIFQDYFKSEEYGTMLKEVINATVRFRKSMDEFTFRVLKETNIATKWELDRAYKEIYDLKKEIKKLQKEIEELKKASKTSAKK